MVTPNSADADKNSARANQIGRGILFIVVTLLIALGVYWLLTPPTEEPPSPAASPPAATQTAQTTAAPPPSPPAATKAEQPKPSAPTVPPPPDVQWAQLSVQILQLEKERSDMLMSLLRRLPAIPEALNMNDMPSATTLDRNMPTNITTSWMGFSHAFLETESARSQLIEQLLRKIQPSKLVSDSSLINESPALDTNIAAANTMSAQSFQKNSPFPANQRLFIIKDNLFHRGRPHLLASAQIEIETIANFIQQYAAKNNILIEGYTDKSQDTRTSLTLSKQRAEAVKIALIKYGIADSRLTAIGRGKRRPLASNETEAGRKENRRVEIKILPLENTE